MFFEDISEVLGHLSDEDYVKKKSCLSVASSFLLVIKSLTSQRNSVVEKYNIILALKNIHCLHYTFIVAFLNCKKDLILFFEDISKVLGYLSGEDYVQKKSCLSAASSFLLVIKTLTGQRNSVVEKYNIVFVMKNIHCLQPTLIAAFLNCKKGFDIIFRRHQRSPWVPVRRRLR